VEKACPNSGKISIEAWVSEKARSQAQDVELPPVKFETSIEGDEIEAGILPKKEESPE
jgi:hypothetical protein